MSFEADVKFMFFFIFIFIFFKIKCVTLNPICVFFIRSKNSTMQNTLKLKEGAQPDAICDNVGKVDIS
jgi:hypothetical protein